MIEGLHVEVATEREIWGHGFLPGVRRFEARCWFSSKGSATAYLLSFSFWMIKGTESES